MLHARYLIRKRKSAILFVPIGEGIRGYYWGEPERADLDLKILTIVYNVS